MPSTKSALPLLYIFLFYQRCTAVTVSFSIYPPASQQCLYNAAEASGCPLEALTLYDINYCLCGNGGHFIDNSAICLHNSDSADTQDVWNTMATACSESGTPIYYSESAFVSIGEGLPVSSSPASSPASYVATAPASSPVSSSHAPVPTSHAASTPVQKGPASSTASSSSSSSSSGRTPGSNSNNQNNGGNNVGSLSGGMIALIGTVAGVVSCIIAFLMCCVSCGGRNKIEKVVKQTLQQHLKQRPSPEQKGLWVNSGYD